MTWINPYDLGWKQNWNQIYGGGHPLLAVLPSNREPEFLPVPMAGPTGRRRRRANLDARGEELTIPRGDGDRGEGGDRSRSETRDNDAHVL